jgi:hypothetical protein
MLIILKVMNSQLKLSQNKNNIRLVIILFFCIKRSGVSVLVTKFDTGKV